MQKNSTNFDDMEQISGGGNCGQHSMNGGKLIDTGFFEYMTTFTTNEKNQVLNLLQYGGLSVLPLLVVLKVLKLYMPVDDPYKSSPELLLEVLVQIFFILVMFFFIHKMVVYLPTYSKLDYDSFSLLSVILPLLFIMFALDTRLSEKTNTLFNRLLSFVGVQESFVDRESENTSEEVKNKGTKTQLKQTEMNLSNGPYDSRMMGSGKEQTRDVPVHNESFMQQESFQPMAANDLGGIGSTFF